MVAGTYDLSKTLATDISHHRVELASAFNEGLLVGMHWPTCCAGSAYYVNLYTSSPSSLF